MRENLGHEPESQACWWLRVLTQQCQAVHDELGFLAPWIGLPGDPDGLAAPPELDTIPTLARKLISAMAARMREQDAQAVH